jgi:uncharacterized protein YgbK (DUF1537 family)
MEALFALGVTGIVLAPAFPLNGRTVEQGVLKVNGVPVHRTEAGRDGLSPVATGDLTALLSPAFGGRTGAIHLDVAARGPEAMMDTLGAHAAAGRTVLVVDAATQGDLAVLAQAARRRLPQWVLSGSAGLARELAALQGKPGAARGGLPACERVLTAAGSRSSVTAGQVASLRNALPCAEAVLDASAVDGSWDPVRAAALSRWVCETLDAESAKLAGDPPLRLLTIAPDRGDTPPELFQERSRRLNEVFGAAIAEALRRRPGTGLVLTGGDVAAAAIAALHAEGIELGPEVLPGIPMGTLAGGPAAGVPVVTKAGAFGPPDALLQSVRALLGQGAGAHDSGIRPPHTKDAR